MELAINCMLYFKLDNNELPEEAAQRLERLLDDIKLEYNIFKTYLRDENGNTIKEIQ